jgi:hypothetical protein
LNDCQVHFAGAETFNIFQGTFGGNDLKFDTLLASQVLDVLGDLKIAPPLGPVAMVRAEAVCA